MPADEHASGAEERIATWVRDHAVAVRGYVLGMVRRPDVADDLAQEVFQRAWQARDRYRDAGHERAFLLTIADRLVIDRSRRLGVEINVDDATWNQVEPTAHDEEIASRETSAELNAALEQLSPNQRRVLLLRYFSDMTFEEIAATMNCPLGTALSHCRRGLTAMRKLLMTSNP
jgi:RNA polymerase sigma-70 factor (ECF subfamily)